MWGLQVINKSNMKKTIKISLIFLIILNNSYSQENKKAEEFLSLINYEKEISDLYNDYKFFIFNNAKSLFEEEKINYNDSTNINEFKKFIREDFNFYISDSQSKIKYFYSNQKEEDLDKFIELARKENDRKILLLECDFYNIFNQVFKEHQRSFIITLPRMFENIKANSEHLKLRLIVDNDTIINLKKSKIELFLTTTNKKFKKINILDKKSGNINIPMDLKNEEIKSLIIKYDDEEHLFFEKRIPDHMASFPESVKESLDPLSQYCFEELTHWNIIIDNDPENNEEIKKSRKFEVIKSDKVLKRMIKIRTRSETYILL